MTPSWVLRCGHRSLLGVTDQAPPTHRARPCCLPGTALVHTPAPRTVSLREAFPGLPVPTALSRHPDPSTDDTLKAPLFWFVTHLSPCRPWRSEYGLVCFVLSSVCTSPWSHGPWGCRNSMSRT